MRSTSGLLMLLLLVYFLVAFPVLTDSDSSPRMRRTVYEPVHAASRNLDDTAFML